MMKDKLNHSNNDSRWISFHRKMLNLCLYNVDIDDVSGHFLISSNSGMSRGVDIRLTGKNANGIDNFQLVQ